MRTRFLMCSAGILIAIATVTAQVRDSRTTSDSGITRRLVIDQKKVQVVRSTYKSGAAEPPGPHPFDVVIVPLTAGNMRLEIASKTVEWKVGEPIFILRGAEHSIANRGETAVDLLSIRIP
jgi:quercetin dioxygenase-like cupin family protein